MVDTENIPGRKTVKKGNPFDVDSRESMSHLEERLSMNFDKLELNIGGKRYRPEVEKQRVGNELRYAIKSPLDDEPIFMAFHRARRSMEPGAWGWAFSYSFGGKSYHGELAEQAYATGSNPFLDLKAWSSEDVMNEYLKAIFEEDTIRSSTGKAGVMHKVFSEGVPSRGLPGAVLTSPDDEPTSFTPHVSDLGKSIISKRITVGISPEAKDINAVLNMVENVMQPNNRYKVNPSDAAFWQSAGEQGYVPYKAMGNTIRLTPANQLPIALEEEMGREGQSWQYKVLAGKIEKLVKHGTVAEPLRPNLAGVGGYGVDPENPKVVKHIEPQFIETGREQGLVRLNLAGFGENMPPANVTRDVATLPATPMSGTDIFFKDPMQEQGVHAILYPKDIERKLYGSRDAFDPMTITQFSGLKLDFGVFNWQKGEKGEKGRWVKTDEQLVGRTLAAREQLTYGVITTKDPKTGEEIQMPLIHTQDEREGAVTEAPRVFLGPSASLGTDRFAPMNYAFRTSKGPIATVDIAQEDRERIESQITGAEVIWEGGIDPTVQLGVGVANSLVDKGGGRKSGRSYDITTIGKKLPHYVDVGGELVEYSAIAEPPKNPVVDFSRSFWGVLGVEQQAQFISEAYPENEEMVAYAQSQAQKRGMEEKQISRDVLLETWNKQEAAGDRPLAPWEFMQGMEMRALALFDKYKEQGQEAEFYKKFQLAELEEQKVYVGEIPAEDVGYWKTRARQAATERANIPPEKVEEAAKNFYSFRKVRNEPRYRMYQRTIGRLGAMATDVVTELGSGRLARLGHQERLSMIEDFPFESKMLGLFPGDSTGLKDPSVEAWKTLRDYVGYQFSGYVPKLSPGSEDVEYTKIYPEEADNILQELMRIDPKQLSLQNLQEAVERWVIRDEPLKGLFQLAKTEELQPSPATWQAVSEIDFSPLGMDVPISSAAKKAPTNFVSWLQGTTHQGGIEGTDLFYQAMGIYNTMAIAGSNIIKGQQQKIVAGHWSHMAATMGIGANEAVMPYDEMRSHIIARAEALGFFPKSPRGQERYIKQAFKSIEEGEIKVGKNKDITMRGLAMFGLAVPTYGRQEMILPYMARTPKMFREQSKLDIPDTTVFNRSGATPGSLNFWAVNMGVGIKAERAMRDFDWDPWYSIVASDFDEKGNQVLRLSGNYRRALEERGVDVAKHTDEVLGLLFGGKREARKNIGTISGIADNMEAMYGHLGKEKWYRKVMTSGLLDTTSKQAFQGSVGFLKTKWEMGAAYNTRRLYESVWGATGAFSEENMSKLYHASATSYAKALEIAESTGNPTERATEQMIRSVHFREAGKPGQETGKLTLGWKLPGSVGHRGWGTGEADILDMQGGLAFGAAMSAIEFDVSNKVMSPEEAFGLMTMQDNMANEDFEYMMAQHESGRGVMDILKEYTTIGLQRPSLTGEPRDFDFSQTIFGEALMTQAVGKAEGRFGRRGQRVSEMSKTFGGQRAVDAMKSANMQVRWQGKDRDMTSLLKDPTIRNALLRQEYFTRTSQPMTVAERYEFERDYQEKLTRVKAGDKGIHIDRTTKMIRDEQQTEQAYRTIQESGATKRALLTQQFYRELKIDPSQMAGLVHLDLGEGGKTSKTALRNVLASNLFGISNWHKQAAVRDADWSMAEDVFFPQGNAFERDMEQTFIEQTGWENVIKPETGTGSVLTPMGRFRGRPDIMGVDPQTGKFMIADFKWSATDKGARQKALDERYTRAQLLSYGATAHTLANPLDAKGLTAEEWNKNLEYGGIYGSIEEGGEKEYFVQRGREEFYGSGPVTPEQRATLEAGYEAIKSEGIGLGVIAGVGTSEQGFGFYENKPLYQQADYTTEEALATYQTMMTNLRQIVNPEAVASVVQELQSNIAQGNIGGLSPASLELLDVWSSPFFREQQLNFSPTVVRETQRAAENATRQTRATQSNVSALNIMRAQSSPRGGGVAGMGGGGGGSLFDQLAEAMMYMGGGKESYMQAMWTTPKETFMAQESAMRQRVAAEQRFGKWSSRGMPAYEDYTTAWMQAKESTERLTEKPPVEGGRSMAQRLADLPQELASDLYDLFGAESPVSVLGAGEAAMYHDIQGKEVEEPAEVRELLSQGIAKARATIETGGEKGEAAKKVLAKHTRTAKLALPEIQKIQKGIGVAQSGVIHPDDLPSTHAQDLEFAKEISGYERTSPMITPLAVAETLTGDKLEPPKTLKAKDQPEFHEFIKERFEETVLKDVRRGTLSKEEALDIKGLSESVKNLIKNIDQAGESTENLTAAQKELITTLDVRKDDYRTAIAQAKVEQGIALRVKQEGEDLHSPEILKAAEEQYLKAGRAIEWNQARLDADEVTRSEATGLGAFSKSLRGLFGGWGLMYMGRLTSMGLGVWEKQYGEAEQYQMQALQTARQRYGAEFGEGIAPLTYAQQTARIRGGGGIYGDIARAGTWVDDYSDITSPAMGGLGAGLLAHWAGPTLFPALGVAAKGATGLAALPPILPIAAGLAAVTAGGLFLANQRENIENYDQTIAMAAAQASSGKEMAGALKMMGIRVEEAGERYQQEIVSPTMERLDTLGGFMGGLAKRGAQPFFNLAKTPYVVLSDPTKGELKKAKYEAINQRILDKDLTIGELKQLEKEMGKEEFFWFTQDFGALDAAPLNQLQASTRQSAIYGGLSSLNDWDQVLDFTLSSGLDIESGGVGMQMAAQIHGMTGQFPTEGAIRDTGRLITAMPAEQQQRVSSTLELIQRTPGAGLQFFKMDEKRFLEIASGQTRAEARWEEGMKGGMPDYGGKPPADELASLYADIARGPKERVDLFLQARGIQEQLRGVGVEWGFDEQQFRAEEEWAPGQEQEFRQDLLYQNMRYSTIEGFSQLGVGYGQASQMIEGLGGGMAGMQFMQRLQSFEPRAWGQTFQRWQGTQFDEAAQHIRPIAAMANYDMWTGQPTTQGMYRTSMVGPEGTMESARINAGNIWGADWMQSDYGRAAVYGINKETGEIGTELPTDTKANRANLRFGEQGMAWTQLYQSYEAQKASLGSSYAMLALQEEYMPKFWDVQDRQRALGHRQQLWQFEQQDWQLGFSERQMEMGARQWEEKFGLQQRQAYMQREWAREDWAYQDQTRSLQWGWKQEDFEENVRFMTGRQRRLAERGMERETTMYNLETGQIETQRDRQQEMWALQDERFEMERKHHEEQLAMQEESLEKQAEQLEMQKQFYEERRQLEEESIALSREYQLKQLELQKAALGTQAEQIEKNFEHQQMILEMNEAQEANLDKAKQLQQEAAIFFDTLLNKLPDVNEAFNQMVDLFIAKLKDPSSNPILQLKDKGGGGGGGEFYEETKQEGGHMFPSSSYLVGERGWEIMRPNTLSSMVNRYDVAQTVGQQDKWDSRSVFYPTQRGGGGGSGPTIVNVYLGNEKFTDFIVNAVKDDLEVV